jgi:hypothetical protein
VESIAEFEAAQHSKKWEKKQLGTSSSSSSLSSASKDPSFSKSAAANPVKTAKEVEKEVAENTAKFDSSLSTRSAKNKRVGPTTLTLKPKPLKQEQIMKILKLFGIITLAAFVGYTSAKTSRVKIDVYRSQYTSNGATFFSGYRLASFSEGATSAGGAGDVDEWLQDEAQGKLASFLNKGPPSVRVFAWLF